MDFPDHVPVHLTLQLGPMSPTPLSWRLNKALLQSKEIHSGLLTTIREYFSINVKSVSNPLVVWEAHKMVVRGALIRIGTRLKRERTEELALICSLECAHKVSLARATFQDLLKAREELCLLLFHKTKQKLAWAMYKFSNKPGALLARALRGPRTMTCISHILASSGRKPTTSSEMATEFRSSYGVLHNLDRLSTNEPSAMGGFTPRSYLAVSGMPSLPIAVQKEPITVAKLGVALANSKPKKAPCPDRLTTTYYKVFFDMLSQPLVSALNSITEGKSFLVDALRAYISK